MAARDLSNTQICQATPLKETSTVVFDQLLSYVSLSTQRLSLIVFRFSFDTRGAKEKLTKENAAGEFRRLRAATNAARVGSAPPFREKVDENNSGFAVAHSSINQNL